MGDRMVHAFALGLTLALVGVSAGSSAPQAVAVAASSGCRGGWVVQQRATFDGFLSGVAAISGADAWAVGGRFDPQTGLETTLAEHWDGRAWVAVSSPNPTPPYGLTGDALFGAAAVSATDVWAVGGAGQMSGQMAGGIAEHWDGTGWTVVPTPTFSGGGELEGAAAVSGRDVWAVGLGDVASANGSQAVHALHWNGTVWTSVSAPAPGSFHALMAVARIPRTGDLWAVGSQSPGRGVPDRPLIERWNGVRWIVLKSPPVGGYLAGVTALGPKGAWAVGGTNAGAPLILHWNGMRWSSVRVPAGSGRSLSGVAALSARSAWAVGSTILYWNGTRWTAARWPKPVHASLDAIAVSASRSGWTAWAVGSWGSSASPLVVSRCG